ncbi:DNA sulfur modification protein DndB [uncultured Williamsia sp.]|uniref:DNA sulfur modification protein DndB n=1 Tax=uncultured Williamsia sp. TaxID=259311 RepID=UPI00262736DA|nr:DNA sulfur modification protein DndB [uncultured Williamsia sp.]
MATLLPAIKSQMGNIEYYTTKMRAADIATLARAASEKDDWATQGIEERIQRKLNEKRVRDELVPYLAKSEDRFFGSIIILVREADIFEYEVADQWLTKAPPIYKRVMSDMGVLTVDGGDLVVLDGQHRWKALKMVSEKKDTRDQAIEGEFVEDVRNDEVTVIFVEYTSSQSTRRMFNKINKSAKPTGRSDNIITSEDDGYAIITRSLLEPGAPLGAVTKNGELIVNWKSNTLGDRSAQLTTVSAVYETVKDICRENGKNFDEKDLVVRPPEDELHDAADIVTAWWHSLVDNIDVYKEAVDKPNAIPALRQRETDNLLLKPAGQIALVRGLLMATERHGVDMKTAIKRANRIDWDVSSSTWEGLLVLASGRIVARAENYRRSAELISYLVAGKSYTAEEVTTLQKHLDEFTGKSYTLPAYVS